MYSTQKEYTTGAVRMTEKLARTRLPQTAAWSWSLTTRSGLAQVDGVRKGFVGQIFTPEERVKS